MPHKTLAKRSVWYDTNPYRVGLLHCAVLDAANLSELRGGSRFSCFTCSRLWIVLRNCLGGNMREYLLNRMALLFITLNRLQLQEFWIISPTNLNSLPKLNENTLLVGRKCFSKSWFREMKFIYVLRDKYLYFVPGTSKRRGSCKTKEG